MTEWETNWRVESDASRRPGYSDTVIGLGANLGSPRLTLLAALAELDVIGEIVAVSALYQTLPVGGPPQPDFCNAAVRLWYAGEPRELLGHLHAIERAAGRERRERWGPRMLDLDILWIEGLRLESETLEVPHPRLRERAFALQPLLDVAPEAVDPADGVAYVDVLRRLGSSGVRQLGWGWVAGDLTDVPPGMDRPCS
jgi:2-amino-4-hydroxy-6-hydroxymethyldihydropteridine diphosphokinase